MKSVELPGDMQEYLARLGRARQVLVACNHALVRATAESELLQQMCRIVVEVGGYRQAWVGVPVDDAAQSIAVAAAAGYDDDPPHVNGITWAADGGFQGATGRVIATGQPLIARDILRNGTGRRRERALARGYQSSVTLPLFAGNRCIGAISIYAGEPDAFDADEIALLTTLAQDISYGVEALRLRAAYVQAEIRSRAVESECKRDELNLKRLVRARRVMAEINHVLVQAASESELLRESCRILVESGGYCQAWVGLAQDDAGKSIKVGGAAGCDPACLEAHMGTWADDGRHQGVIGHVIATGKAYTSQNISAEDKFLHQREQALERGYQSAITLPLKIEDRCIGGLSIYAFEPDAFDADEINLLDELAADLAFGIKSFRARSARERAEAMARKNEERYRTIFENAAVGITSVDLNGFLTDANQKFFDMLGYPREELLGKAVKDITHPDDYGQGAQFRDELAHGAVRAVADEKRFVRKDGSIMWAKRTMSVVCNDAGQPEYLVSVVEDISDRKRIESALRRKNELTSLLESLAVAANQATSPQEAMQACLARICGHTGWPVGHAVIFGKDFSDYQNQTSIWFMDDARRWTQFREASEPFRYIVDAPGFINSMLSGKRPLWVKDISRLKHFYRGKVARESGIKAAFAFPVVAGSRVVAFIEFYSDRIVEPDILLMKAINNISAQLGRVAERHLAENTLRESERFARATIDALPQHISVIDETGRIVAVNKAWRDFAAGAGGGPEQVWEDVDYFSVCDRVLGIGEKDATAMAAGIREVLTGMREAFTLEYTCYLSARKKWFLVKVVPFPGEGPRRAVISHEDITERMLSAHRRTMEHAVARVLSESVSLDEAMPRLIRTICEAMEWAYGARWAWNDAEKTLVRREFWSDSVLQFDGEDESLWLWLRLQQERPGGLLRRAWVDKEPTWIVDLRLDDSFRRRKSALKLGLVSAYAFPITAGGQMMGVMEFFGRETRQPDEVLLQITHTIGSQIGQFIHRKQAEEDLRLSEERFRTVFSSANVGITISSLDLRYLQVNDRYCEMIGYSRGDLMQMTIKDVILPADIEEAVMLRKQLVSGEIRSYYRERQLLRKDGTTLWVSLVSSLIRGNDGEPQYFVSVIQDMSERKRAELALRESEEKFRQLADNIPEAFWIADIKMRELLYLSPVYEKVTGKPVAEAMKNPQRCLEIVHPDDRRRVRAARMSLPHGDYNIEYRVVCSDGSLRWIHDQAYPVRDGEGRIYRIAGIAADITQRKAAEEKLVYLAHYDGLTGLPNRILFRDRLEQTLAQARRRNWLVGVMMLDLDRFKVANDSLGHGVGDSLLKQVAGRLTDCVRVGDTVGRFGGDEFAIILSDLRNAEDARLVAQKALDAFAEPFQLERNEVYITASVGISMYPADSDDLDVLIKSADTALHRAKDAGRNNFQFFTAEMNARVLHRLSMENSLRRALERREFLLHYQPKASLKGGNTTGLEALLRWQHPELGLVAPGEFVPLLEETGLIIPVGEWVFGAACAQLKAWAAAGIQCVPIAINLSSRQFLTRGFGSYIRRLLDEYEIDPRLIELEITESSLMANTEDVVHTLEYLESIGVRISIDDFGTGYSSLSYLKRFPLDALKIDSSFVRDIISNAEDATIVRAIISMAGSLGLKVVAEGVETEAQMSFLAANGCDEIQGYYLSRPLTPGDCSEWLQQGVHLSHAVALRSATPTVLLVDDDEDMLVLLMRALSQDGYYILTAYNAGQAFEVLSRHRVDVVISDHQMPGMPGVEFLQRVKSLYPDTVRIMCSGLADFQTVTEAVNKGEIFRFLPKDMDPRRLRLDVREALSARTSVQAREDARVPGPGGGA